ncbi:N-acetyltransferase [Paenibacillus nanensis]|uniref:N-acetyltransferase n=1 Tax=Paenibacillus nanensis TaxID=393251 RepID=A0A3A1US23_9BACL|nr:GNAT family protein [Paenibacillus nanensis]RIX51035.1 N-acetyltransferase [Paenibacillus nanensis]
MEFHPNLTLENQRVKLVHLQSQHVEPLADLLCDPRIWEYTWRKRMTAAEVKLALETAIRSKESGLQLPFAIEDRRTGLLAGTTRLGDTDLLNRSVEIGWTWLSPAFWGTGLNAACKLLLLEYCFEQLGVIRVQFSASGKNERSQRALEKIGAVKEGVLRRHRVDLTDSGAVHDNVFFSILDSEWPQVKTKLQSMLK